MSKTPRPYKTPAQAVSEERHDEIQQRLVGIMEEMAELSATLANQNECLDRLTQALHDLTWELYNTRNT